MIRSASNGQMKMLRLLAKDGKERLKRGVYPAEGKKIFREIRPEDIAAVYVSESFAKEQYGLLLEKNLYESSGEETAFWMHEARGTAKAPSVTAQAEEYEAGEDLRRYFTVVEDSVFAQIADTKNTQGILTVARLRAWDLEAVLSEEAPLFLIAEHLQDPGNAGTILRSAEAAGAAAVFFTEDSVDVTNPKVVRSAMGSLSRIPVFYGENARHLILLLKEHGVKTYAAALTGSADYDTLSYTGGTAFLIGNESRGLTEEAQKSADKCVLIPMTEHIDSLNAGVAASVLLFEAARQRRLSRV